MRAAAVCLLLAFLVGLVAIGDHRWKQSRINAAELSEWYCRNEGKRCGGPSSARMETHWNERQLGYEVAVGALGAAAVVVAARARARRR